MKLSHQNFEHISLLTLSGEFTADDTEQFRRATQERVSNGARHIVLDIENVDFIDSAGLEALLRLQERLGEQAGQLRLIKLDPSVERILALTRLDLAFETHESVEQAVRSLR